MEHDDERLAWLERMALQKGGILLHDGSESGRLGLGLRPCGLRRTLREAIDDAMGKQRIAMSTDEGTIDY